MNTPKLLEDPQGTPPPPVPPQTQDPGAVSREQAWVLSLGTAPPQLSAERGAAVGAMQGAAAR